MLYHKDLRQSFVRWVRARERGKGNSTCHLADAMNSTGDIWHVDYTQKRLEQAAQGWSSIALVFSVNCCMFAVACVLFRLSRSSRTSLFFMGATNSNFAAYPFNQPHMTEWQHFVAFLSTPNDVSSLQQAVGDEGAFYLTFQVYALKMVLAMTTFAFLVLIPTYVLCAPTSLAAFSTMTIRAVPDKSPLLWVSVASCYVFSAMYAIFLTQLGYLCNNKDPTNTNLLCMIPSELSAKTVLVDAGAPKCMSPERTFYLLDQIFPGLISHVAVVYDLTEYKRSHTIRIANENAVDRLTLLLTRKHRGALPWYVHLFHEPRSYLSTTSLASQIQSLQRDIDKRHSHEIRSIQSILTTHRGTGRVFIIFNDPKAKARFVRKIQRRSTTHLVARTPKQHHATLRQKIHELSLLSWHLELAPEPDDLDWHFISYHRAKRTALTALIYTFLTVFIVLFTSPLAVTSAIASGTYAVTRAMTPAEYDDAVRPWNFYTGTQSALQISVLVVIVAFSTVVPVILPFGAFYLSVQHVVDKYALLYVRPKIKGKGAIAATSTHASMFALVIYQCAMAGFFLVRGTWHQIAAVIALLVVSSVFMLWQYIRDKGQLYRSVGQPYKPEQTMLLSPNSKCVDMYRDPVLRLLDATTRTQSERYGSIVLP
ncbi:hypothetical protein DYB36_001166 [Aphanomyces astaci]|uniref:CSC1/OSCA1-like 7TM region domain-containing protein n=3 Tax=Aphanomyces astaci TaxID=112090 RepID=A0A396ZSF2_APHAT|nr:hypothetical protein DYB36_001166 [Aphanomyces astaci]